MDIWGTQHWHLAWMIPAVFLIVYLGSPRHRGQIAFRRVKRLLEQSLDPRRFSQFHDLVIPTGGGRETLDHVVVSRSGISIIVSEFRKGAISGGESQELWKEERFGRTRRWPNPIYRAKLQMETLQDFLGLPREYFQVLVAIEGQDRLAPHLPAQLVRVERLEEAIRTRRTERFSEEQANRVVQTLSDKHLSHVGVRKELIAQLGLALLVAAGVYVVYGDDLGALIKDFDGHLERVAAPERFDEGGRRKTEQELFEASLACAYSTDTERCACYVEGGEKVQIEAGRCRELAERGSILRQ
ncbi:MAG: nuclease-related domain-containing protein [Xanthomonadales bacterium]|nr:nuclease-related domain-containing protein [Xanthomonadales bacterium]